MGLIISITNQKGGVGKTTTAVNLAASLARNRKRTLIIDFDPQGHATEHVGIRTSTPESQTKTVLEALNHTQKVQDCIFQTYMPNLFILPANLRLGQFNQNAPQGKQFLLKDILVPKIKDQFDFILIDCQPSLSLLTLNALTTSDKVLLPVQAEFLALDGLMQLVITLKDVQQKLHPKLEVLGILLTMFDTRNRLSGEVQNELAKNFDKDLFHTVIPRNVKLAEAPSFGKTIFDYDSFSTGAQAYEKLSGEILTKLK